MTALALRARTPAGEPVTTLPAGSSAVLAVGVETEDGGPLPAASAAAGLAVRVVPPGGGRAEAEVLRLVDAAGAPPTRLEGC